MKSFSKTTLAAALAATLSPISDAADSFGEAITETRAAGNFNLRYEDVDNSTITSDGLTLRSRLSMTTGTFQGFGASASMEDVRDMLGIDDEGDLILDPEVTEIDTAFVQYKSDMVTATAGRQVIALDNQRHVGHVGWRQDRQTFDGIRTTFAPMGGTSIDLAYITQYNRIVAEDADRDANSFLLNASYQTSLGKLTAYAYLLEDETVISESDTYGTRFNGSKDNFIYTAEFATQSSGSFDASYYLLEAGVKVSGLTAKLGYELRGSDNGNYGFSTPLATGHAFNGWADVYLLPGADGMSDLYFALSGKAGKVNLTAVYHDYKSDELGTDKGSEVNLVATIPLAEGATGGLKYAAYSQGDASTAADRDKLWIWLGYNF